MIKLYPYQVEGVRLIDRHDGTALLADEMGLGKAQPLSAKVLTPSGWRLMGELRVGDSVIGGGGKPTKIIGVFPQGHKEVFRIRFRDGSQTRCCDEHLWAVWSPAAKHNGYKAKVKKLAEIRQQLTLDSGNCRFQIPIVQPVEFQNVPIPVHPYLLGCLLGDGYLVGPTLSITTADQQLIREIESLLPKGMKLGATKKTGEALSYNLIMEASGSGNKLTEHIKKLGVHNHRSNSKFIPTEYLHNDKEVRLGTLQGLMDTDGFVSKTGTVQFCSVSEKLADGVRELVWSMGGVCSKSSCVKTYTHNGEKHRGQLCFILTIGLPATAQPFRLKRKLDRYVGRTKYQPTRPIVSVEPDGVEECQCIKVENEDGLYVTDDYVVTHNTPTSINYYKNFIDSGPCLVVCPSNVKYNWQREFAAQGIRAEVLGSRTPSDEQPTKLMQQKKTAYIINYDVVGPWLGWLGELNPSAFLFDEAHAIKNRDSLRAKHIRKISRFPGLNSIVAISGTPLTNRPHELWSILNVLWPKDYPSFWAFAFKYCEARRAPWGWQFTGAKNLDELHAELKEKGMIRRLKRDVLKDLPDKTRMVITVDLPQKARKEYDEAEKRFLQWLRKRSKRKADAAAKAERLVQMGYLKRLAAELKMKSVYEWVDDFLEETDDKLIAFGVHKKVVRDGLFERYKKQAVVIDGGVDAKERQLLVDRFTKNKTCRLFVGNIQAAGVGWNGTAASTVLFAELDWVPANHTQAEDRPHRIGQRGNVLCVYLVAKDTIEHRLCEVLQEKQEVITHTLDGVGRVRDQQLDLMDRLEQKLLESRSRG